MNALIKKTAMGNSEKQAQSFPAKVIYYFEMSYASPSSDWIKSSIGELFSIFEILYPYIIIVELLMTVNCF